MHPRIPATRPHARLSTALCSSLLVLAANAAQAQERTEETTSEPQSAETVVLDQITLTAIPGTMTEGSDSWTTEWMRSATGMILTQKETPQSTSAITQEQMKDRNITTIAETMEAATGITVQALESDRISYYSRGFQIDAYQYDGVPLPRDGAWTMGSNNPDMVLYDHVEIVRGATGLMHGAGEPGASINFIRKRPTDSFQSEAAFSLVDPDGARVESDISGPLNASGTIRGRLIGAYDDRDGTLDGYNKKKYVLFGALDADLTDSTLLSAGLIYQKSEGANATAGGLPPYYTDGGLIDWDWGSTLGTDWSYVDTERTEAFASLEHEFSNGWAGRIALTHIDSDFDSQYLWNTGVPDRETGLGMTPWPSKYKGNYKLASLNGQLNGDFLAMGRTHQFVLGATASRGKGQYDGYDVDRSTVAPLGNVFDWDGSYPEPEFSDEVSRRWTSWQRQYGLYGALRFAATDRLAITAGARVNWWKGKETSPGGLEFEYSYDGEITPYLGLTYDLTPDWTAYGSVTSIYKPQLAQDADGNYLDPTYGWNYEAGIKGELMEGALFASAAIFQTDQKDVADYLYRDPDTNRRVYELVDGTKTRGFELEAAGAINDRWNVSAGYTFRLSKDQDGNELYMDQPRHTLKLATDYRVAGILDDKLTLGGALRWQSGTDSLDFNSDVEQPNVHQGSYSVYDLNASYEISDQTELSLSVNNLFNKKYYATTGFYDTVVYGDGRSAEITLRKRF